MQRSKRRKRARQTAEIRRLRALPLAQRLTDLKNRKLNGGEYQGGELGGAVGIHMVRQP